ncbi:MAG: hypothetical protein AAF936_11810 [Pseudomonadota bacterium]
MAKIAVRAPFSNVAVELDISIEQLGDNAIAKTEKTIAKINADPVACLKYDMTLFAVKQRPARKRQMPNATCTGSASSRRSAAWAIMPREALSTPPSKHCSIVHISKMSLRLQILAQDYPVHKVLFCLSVFPRRTSTALVLLAVRGPKRRNAC